MAEFAAAIREAILTVGLETAARNDPRRRTRSIARVADVPLSGAERARLLRLIASGAKRWADSTRMPSTRPAGRIMIVANRTLGVKAANAVAERVLPLWKPHVAATRAFFDLAPAERTSAEGKARMAAMQNERAHVLDLISEEAMRLVSL